MTPAGRGRAPRMPAVHDHTEERMTRVSDDSRGVVCQKSVGLGGHGSIPVGGEVILAEFDKEDAEAPWLDAVELGALDPALRRRDCARPLASYGPGGSAQGSGSISTSGAQSDQRHHRSSWL